MVMALPSLVLLIACANVATLIAGRSIARQREMALRVGLGATRRRLVRQLLSESLLLALLGGAGGVLAALWVTDLISAIDFGAGGIGTIIFDVTMDWRVFAFTGAVATLTGAIAGLAPALRVTRVDLTRAIGSGGRGVSRGASGRRLTSGLVVAQVGMSMLLLVCAGLLVRSQLQFAAVDLGFRTDHVLLATVNPRQQGYAPAQALGLYRDVAQEVAALPGVQSASWARTAPQAFDTGAMRVVTLGQGASPDTAPRQFDMNRVDPAFFGTLDIPVLRGRGFRDEDATDGRPVAVISETVARQLWPDEDPLGKRFAETNSAGEMLGREFEVIGVVRDAFFSMALMQGPGVVLLPFGQQLSYSATLLVHTQGPPTAFASAVTEAIHRRDPTLAVYGITSMESYVASGGQRIFIRVAAVVGTFGALGMLIAAVGLYGLVADSVSQRRHEFAVRTALGATAADIVRLAVRRGMALIVIGLALGALAAAGVAPFVAGFLIDVAPRDPVVFVVTGLLLVGVALVACWVPSRRAARADPLAALNAE